MIMRKYEITKEQIRLIEHQSVNKDYEQVARDVREWFPDAFKTELKVGKWYKSTQFKKWNLYITEVDHKLKIVKGFGFGADGSWMENALNDSWDFNELEKCVQMKDSEVSKTLEKECVKRGLVEGVMIKSFIKCYNYSTLSDRKAEYNKIHNQLYLGGCLVFDNGKFNVPVPAITKSEAEEILNCKIID